MAGYKQKIQESSSCSVHEAVYLSWVFSVCWNPKVVASNASERKELLARQEEAGKKQKLSCPISFYRVPAEGGALIKSRFKVCLPTSKILD